MNEIQMRDYLALLDEFSIADENRLMSLAGRVREFSASEAGRFVKFRVMNAAAGMMNRALRGEAGARDKMQALLEMAADPETFARTMLDREKKEPYQSHFRAKR